MLKMCYSGKCIWEKDSGDCGYPQDVFFREIFPHTMCYFGDVDDDNENVKTVKIAYECHKKLRKLKSDQQHERVGILKRKGVNPLLYIDERCPITTPFDIFHNQEIEKINKHGSVGVGVGATINREEKFYSLQFGDLFHEPVMRIKLDEIRKYYNLKFEINLDMFFKSVERIISCNNIKPQYGFPESDEYIFEGSQGLLLDPNIGFFPHVTRSYVSTKNIIDSGFNPELYLVTRAYQTRHGNGSMVGENISHNILINPNETNVTHPHQGVFRRTLLNLDLLVYSINKDPYIRFSKNKILVITCLDHIVNEHRFTYKNEIITSSNEDEFIQKVSEILGIKNVLISKSDESKNIINWRF